MKPCARVIAACIVLMSCEKADPVRYDFKPIPPQATGVPTFTGIVRDENGRPLQGARAEILGGPWSYWGMTATTNEMGVFGFENVMGELWVQVGKAGYHSTVDTYTVDPNTRINIVLVSGMLPNAVTSDTIQVGSTIRGVTNQPPCDPTQWDARAPCRRYDFLSPSPGHLDVTISHVGFLMDATIVSGFGNRYLDTSEEAGLGKFTLSIDVAAYTYYEIRVNSYYEQQEFNLLAEFIPSEP